MANCDPQTLMNNGKCFFGVKPKEAMALKLQLLCEIQAAIASLGSVVANLGPTVEAIAYAASIDIDLDGADYQTLALTGDIDFNATLNRPVAGRAKAVAVVMTADGSDRNITFNANWTVIGSTPSVIAAGKTGVFSLTAIGPNETDVLIVYQEEP
jgi:voltage-gated potassium channel Kch